ncbi:diacylglycerol/lipid kinase family protein [Nocardioides luteus]|uniref:Diacylglycerol kinase n=1 Tax=Nocardioides luteus TaxID=1844 RepID=A0ABQ5T2L9_9ACTN|nr:YegS/Rv2252/BmrU family lipid kinase [Nocardioides luteus]GGR40570.1 diacylglycerol kinase [Nocardioides luteus]GLJ69421.1 diacylglycerol kinase [Nocardioides luteus]
MRRVTRQIALLANPTAGRGDADRILDAVTERLTVSGASVEHLIGDDAEHALELARKAVADGVDTVATLGGDGMVHVAVQALAGSEVSLGVVPLGTGNDFARALGIPTGDPLAATDVVVRHQTRRVDLGRARRAGTGSVPASDTWFATVLAAGFDAAVNERANAMRWPHGDLRYTLAALAVIRGWKPVPYRLEIEDASGEVTVREQPAMLLAVANTESYGGGMRIAADADPADGLLDAILIKPVSRLEFLRVFPGVRQAKHLTHPAFERIHARRITATAPDVVAYSDGERLGPLPLDVECVPGALRVLV